MKRKLTLFMAICLIVTSIIVFPKFVSAESTPAPTPGKIRIIKSKEKINPKDLKELHFSTESIERKETKKL